MDIIGAHIAGYDIEFRKIDPNAPDKEFIRVLNHDGSVWMGNLGYFWGFAFRYILANFLTAGLYRHYFGREKMHAWIMTENNIIMGFIALDETTKHDIIELQKDKKYYRFDMALLRPYQNKGIASGMMDTVRTLIKSLNDETEQFIIFHVLSHNKHSRHVIERTEAKYMGKERVLNIIQRAYLLPVTNSTHDDVQNQTDIHD